MTIKTQNLLVCGGTGFIGKNLVEYYLKKKEYCVFATYFKSKPHLKNKRIKWLKVDLRKTKDVKKIIKDVDIVIQAAATTSGAKDIVTSPHLHVTDNAVMNSVILRECFNNNIKHFIFFSCTVMYPSSNRPLSEKDLDYNKELLDSYYGVGNTKIYIEKMCKFFSDRSSTKYTVIRHTNIFGPYDKFDLKKSHFFGATVNKIHKTLDKKIEVWGDGKEKRDLLYIDDLLNFVNLSIKKQKSKYEIFNCSYGKSFSINNIINKIIKISKLNIKITYNKNRPTIKTNIKINSYKAKKKLGWRPKIQIDDAIKKTIKWYNKNYNVQ